MCGLCEDASSYNQCMARPKALIFDLDGTLVESDVAAAEGVRYACEVIAGAVADLTPIEVRAANDRAFASLWPVSERDWTLGRITGEAFSKQVWRLTLQTLGRFDAGLISMAYDAMTRQTGEVMRAFDDAVALLPALKGRYRLGCITNGAKDTQAPKLGLEGLEGVFEAVAVSGTLGFAKPDFRIFHHVLGSLGVLASEAWHIGDSPSLDIAGANAVGMTSVFINRRARVLRPQEAQPAHEITSLSELPALLDAAG